MPLYLAHRRETGEEQSVRDHLTGTAELSRAFGEAFGLGTLAFWCGILHDVGKYSDRFQAYIGGKRDHVDHSTAGAQLIRELFPLGNLLAYCIAGHHSGLPDGGDGSDGPESPTLNGRMKKVVDHYEAYRKDFDLQRYPAPKGLAIQPQSDQGFSVAFAVRMLFSCLTDADFLDTERFMKPGGIHRGEFCSIAQLEERLAQKLRQFQNPSGAVNQKRTEILNQCLEKAEQNQNLFTLTVPTGGGKTFASLAFALRHARRNGMTRVIYVIPYTSIIEQNARVFKEALGEQNVLEHHSNFDFNRITYDDIREKQRLASENWDVPVVVTTNVQFFESLFAARGSRCRKLHNIANSVIIFDEAQMLPLNYLRPCVSAIAELVRNYRCTAVLCSATQPALNRIFPKGFAPVELIGGTRELFDFFQRTELVFRGSMTDQEVADEMNARDAALCIVSTKKHAKKLFGLLKGGGDFHLSALMCPKHRSAVIAEIRRRLSVHLPCRVISTQIIEAGVDVDFPVLYRSMAGLDEIIQAAGRCNREGRMTGKGRVNLFVPANGAACRLPADLRRPVAVTEEVMRHYSDLTSPEAIRAFFTELYRLEGEGLDSKGIMAALKRTGQTGSIPFQWIEQEFRIIENDTKTIVVPYAPKGDEKAAAEIAGLIRQLRFGENTCSLLRALQPYTVSVYCEQYKHLLQSGAIDLISEDTAILTNPERYSETTGLDTILETGQAVFL